MCLLPKQTLNTIAAISTPIGYGGIAVIRVSGEKALALADLIFTPISADKTPSRMDGYSCAYGKIVYKEEILDECILTVYKKPRSYTGEDVVEISVHGGVLSANRVLRALFELGAEPANAGEFTERALLNGKMTLTQAEAVMDIIAAKGAAELRSAVSVREGVVYRKIRAVTNSLVKLSAGLGVWADYPDDEDIENIADISREKILTVISGAMAELHSLTDSFRAGQLLKAGIPLVIAGKPNVGKSSIMNRLSGTDRSIVTDIPGTTRDVVEDEITINGNVFRVFDTAGIRETADRIEKAGTDRAKQKINEAEIILAVFDSSRDIDEADEEIIRLTADNENLTVNNENQTVNNENLTANKNNQTEYSYIPSSNPEIEKQPNPTKISIAILNKCDKTATINKEYITKHYKTVINLSAKSGEGIDELLKTLSDTPVLKAISGAQIILNDRQNALAQSAERILTEAKTAAISNANFDAITILIDSAASKLLELTGENITKAIADSIFENFCVGK
jgi:tRNA modification GTPase